MKKIMLALTAVLLFIFVTACSTGEQNWNGTFYQHLDDDYILAFTIEREEGSNDLHIKKTEIETYNGLSMSSSSIYTELIDKNTAGDINDYHFKLDGDTLEVKWVYSGLGDSDYGTDFSGVYTRGEPIEDAFNMDDDEDVKDTFSDTDAIAVLIADFGDGFEGPIQVEYTWDFESPLYIETLAEGLSETTGLDFYVSGEIDGDKAYVTWHDDSTLVAGLDDREQKSEFFFYDAVSLNWFMMDSLATTIKKNFYEVNEVYYSGEGGEPVVFPNPEDMASQGLPVLPVNMPYEGSAFFISHADGRGDMGMDLKPNLYYTEEYELSGDPGEYKAPYEAAEIIFDQAKVEGYIPDYSSSIVYTMTLTDFLNINDEECYVFRCDGYESTTFAYAYKSDNIYMKNSSGQWELLSFETVDPANVNWWGKYNSVDYVLGITNYNGTSFNFTIDDSEEDVYGVAALNPDDPYVAEYGDMIFTFDGIDTIYITGGDYEQMYYRSQY